MTRSTFVLMIFVVLLTASCSKISVVSPGTAPTASSKLSSETLVTASAQTAEIPANGSADAIVKVKVQDGYHINGNPASFPYLIATEIEIPESDGVSVNYIYYPNPLVKKFSFSPDEPLRVYEGETELKVALEAAETATKGQRSMAGTLRIQACDDQVCYPPGTIAIEIPVLVK